MALLTNHSQDRSITPEMVTLTSTIPATSLSLRRKSMKQLRLSLSEDSKPQHTNKRQRLAPTTPIPQHHSSYQHGPIAILPFLFIGNETNAHSLDQLGGIDCLLNVAAEVNKPSYETVIPWSDKLSKKTHPAKGYYKLATLQHGEQLRLSDAMELIDQAKKHKKVVLVHCQCGVARSATVVIGYIMHSLGLSLQEAYAFVQLRAPAIGPNLALLYQLQSLEKEHHQRKLFLSTGWKDEAGNKTIDSTLRKRKLRSAC